MVVERAEQAERERLRLLRLAYRMLGSASEAEDIVQDVTVRFLQDRGDVRAADRYLTSMTVRACIDQLRSARRRREQYVGPWLPEPVPAGDATLDPGAGVELAESISFAFMVMLEALSPLERAAFLLHVAFDYEYAEVAQILGRSEAACRQLVSRARAHVRERRQRFDAPASANKQLTERFLSAAREGDVAGLVRLLTHDAALWADGGGKVAAAINPLEGAERVARYLVGVFRKTPMLDATVEDVNGTSGIIVYHRGRPDSAISLAVQNGLVSAVFNQRNPDKLRRFAEARGGRGASTRERPGART